MFINRALPHNSRTVDQMRQAARSCKHNIVEGVSDGTVSAEMCLRLLGVARGSARELLEDYADFLRQRDFEIWSKEDSRRLSHAVIALTTMIPGSLLQNAASAATRQSQT